jgi:anti-sigma B factor antagonist
MPEVDALGRLTIEVRECPDRVILGLGGELDLANASQLLAAIATPAVESKRTIVFDLGRLEFIDSAGLRVILAAADDAQARGQRFALTGASEQVQRLLEVTGATKRLARIGAADDTPA